MIGEDSGSIRKERNGENFQQVTADLRGRTDLTLSFQLGRRATSVPFTPKARVAIRYLVCSGSRRGFLLGWQVGCGRPIRRPLLEPMRRSRLGSGYGRDSCSPYESPQNMERLVTHLPPTTNIGVFSVLDGSQSLRRTTGSGEGLVPLKTLPRRFFGSLTR